MIAGLNTAPAEKKAALDKKKLCRAAGVLCLVVSVLLGMMAFLGYRVETGVMPESGMIPVAIKIIAVVFITLIAVIRHRNTRC